MAYEEVTLIKDTLNEIRNDAEKEYKGVYEQTEEMAKIVGTQVTIPRRCDKRTT